MTLVNVWICASVGKFSIQITYDFKYFLKSILYANTKQQCNMDLRTHIGYKNKYFRFEDNFTNASKLIARIKNQKMNLKLVLSNYIYFLYFKYFSGFCLNPKLKKFRLNFWLPPKCAALYTRAVCANMILLECLFIHISVIIALLKKKSLCVMSTRNKTEMCTNMFVSFVLRINLYRDNTPCILLLSKWNSL